MDWLLFLDRKINSWQNQNKDVVILIPKPKLMVLKKHFSVCNLYTFINYLGQGVKTIPNDITFRQPTEYFQHWVRCDISLLVFVKNSLNKNILRHQNFYEWWIYACSVSLQWDSSHFTPVHLIWAMCNHNGVWFLSL